MLEWTINDPTLRSWKATVPIYLEHVRHLAHHKPDPSTTQTHLRVDQSALLDPAAAAHQSLAAIRHVCFAKCSCADMNQTGTRRVVLETDVLLPCSMQARAQHGPTRTGPLPCNYFVAPPAPECDPVMAESGFSSGLLNVVRELKHTKQLGNPRFEAHGLLVRDHVALPATADIGDCTLSDIPVLHVLHLSKSCCDTHFLVLLATRVC